MPGEAFATLFGLTPGELSLVSTMSPGLCVREVADRQGISETTARTHLHHIFMKTGTTKQTELLRLFASYALPILATARPKLLSLVVGKRPNLISNFCLLVSLSQ